MIEYTTDGDPMPAYERINKVSRENDIRYRRLDQRMRAVENVFCILDRDDMMENMYPELRAAYKEYNRVLEKCKIFSVLSESNGIKP